MSLKITIIGCGNSSGVPSAGNYWGQCDPQEPKNRRSRCCLAVQSEETNLIIDTGADFRHQMNAFNLQKLDAVLYSHQHSDHCHGLDDLRPYYFRNNRQPVPCYGHSEALEEVVTRFDYLFYGGNHSVFYPAILKAIPFEQHEYGSEYQIGDITFIPFEMDHSTCTTVGYRFGDVSYCVDMKRLDQKALDIIKGSKIWIVDGAGYKNPDNDVHADLETLYHYQDYIQADQVFVTCLSTMMDYKTLSSELPQGFLPAYDGMQIRR